MYLTHSFVAISKGKLNYLFFYLTEDYIEEQEFLRKKLNPILERFGRDLLDKAAIVKAFDKDIENANKELADHFDQEFSCNTIIEINNKKDKPGLLIMNSDIRNFDTKENEWIYISLSDFIDEKGNVVLLSMIAFFNMLKEAVLSDKNLFDEIKQYLKKKKSVSAYKMIELKPGIFGISIDLKEAFNFLGGLRNKY